MATDPNGDLDSVKVVQEARAAIASALALLQQMNSMSAVLGDTSTSFRDSLQDAIFEIDSQPDIVDPYLDPAIGLEASAAEVGSAFTIGSMQVPRRLGRLQRIRAIKVALFGGKVIVRDETGIETTSFTTGLMDSFKKVPSAGTEEGG